MNLKYVDTYKYDESKKFLLLIDENNNYYIEKYIEKSQYNTFKIISDACKKSDNLLPIIAFYTSKTKPDIYNYIIPKLNGKTLEQLIKSKTKMSTEHVKNVIFQVCNALKTLHEYNIIHKDIKPANVFITTDGVVKLIDYDIASIYDQDDALKYAGTIGYASPEQYGFAKLEFSTDIYALGVTISQVIKNCCIDLEFQYSHIIDQMTNIDVTNRIQSVEQILKLIKTQNITLFQPQIEQIKKAQNLGLNKEQIKTFSKPHFNEKQMGVLKHCLKQNISQQLYNVICDPQFNSRQMYQLKLGEVEKLTFDQIMMYAKFYLSSQEMSIYRSGLINDLSIETIYDNISFYNNLKNSVLFDEERLKVIRYCFYTNMTITDINVIAHKHLSINKMKKIIEILKEDKYD